VANNYPKTTQFPQHCTKAAEQIELVFGTEASLDLSAYPTLCWKKIRVSSKIRVLPSRTFTRILD